MPVVSTEISTLLDVLENVETTMAELYTWLGRALVVDPEAARFFAEMARDELRHRDLVRFQRALVMKSRRAFAPVTVDATAVTEVIDRVRAFRRDHPEPVLEQALAFVIELEGDAAETHYRTAIADSEPSMAKLMTRLGKADEHHAETVRAFARARGVLAPAPDGRWSASR